MQHRFKRHDPHTIPKSPETTGPRTWPQVTLEIVRGRAQNRFRPVTEAAFLLGAAVDCDLVLGASTFPEVYAYLLLGDDEVSIRHLGFVPELRVNGRSVTKAVLEDGDEIEMSPYLMRVHVQKNRSRSAPPADISNRDQQEADDAAIRDEVDELLSDIRASFLPDMQHLRLYVESKPGPPQEVAKKVETELPFGRRRASGN